MISANANLVEKVVINDGDTGLSSGLIDVIYNFTTTKDQLKFDSHGAGSTTTYGADSATNTNYDDALSHANTYLAASANSAKKYVGETVGSDLYIFVDINGDHTADEAIELAGITTIAAGDIVA